MPVTADTAYTTKAYDAEGRLQSIIVTSSYSPYAEQPVRIVETWAYDAAGRPRADQERRSGPRQCGL